MGKTLRTLTTLANLLLLTALLFGFTRQVEAQEGIGVTNIQVEYDFGEEIRFSAQVESSNPIKEILLIFRDISEENTRVISLEADKSGQISYAYDASKNLLRPFAEISYWFQVVLENGEKHTSEKNTFTSERDGYNL